jgi:hypothetical protein
MAKFRVYEDVVVQVISMPIEAETPLEAYAINRAIIDLDQLLRNITGTVEVAEVKFNDRRVKATVELLDDQENGIGHLLEMDETDLDF